MSTSKGYAMSEYINRFLSTLVFLTRIPVRIPFKYEAKVENVFFFPLVGIIIGATLVGISYLSSLIFSPHVTAIITVFILVVITGGLHLDGLSDSFDGLLSYRDKEKIILIMKDSRVGAMGLLAVVFVVLFKIAFVQTLIESGEFIMILALPLIGRLSLVMACYKGRTISKSIMGEPFIGKLSKRYYYGIIFFYGALAVSVIYLFYGLIYGISFIFTVFILHFIVIYFKKFSYEKIDGISGDILGAICEMSETIYVPLFYTGVFICKLFI